MNSNIRQATEKDKNFVRNLDRENMTPIITESGEKYYGGMFESFNPRKVFIIENSQGESVGFARIHIPGNKLDVWSFQIKEEFQRKGYGKELMKFLITLAKEKKLKKVILEAHNTNKKANSFYEKFGFTRTIPKTKKKEKVGYEYRIPEDLHSNKKEGMVK